MDFIGVYHHVSGVTIEVGKQTFLVEQGCSGISSLLSTLACVLFYVAWYRVSWLRGSLLTLSSIFWVLINNATRIIGITFFGVGFYLFGGHRSMNLVEGIPHQIFGFVLFFLTLFMLWSTDRLLMFFGRSDEPRRRVEPLPTPAGSLETSWQKTASLPGAWLSSMAIAGLFGLLTALQALDLYSLVVRAPYSGSALAKLYEGVDLDTMPAKIGPWIRASKLQTSMRPAGDPLGQYSRAWKYQVRGTMLPAALSLDYPYPEFHDLRVCYSMQGWKFDATEEFNHQTDNQNQHCVQVKMHQDNERYGYLWFCSFDQDGVAMDPSLEAAGRLQTEKSIGDRVKFRIEDRLNQWKQALSFSAAPTTGMGSILQVQMLILSSEVLPDNAVASAKQVFVEGVTRIRKKCLELKAGTAPAAPETGR